MDTSDRLLLTLLVVGALIAVISVGGTAVHALLTHAVAALDATVPR